MKSNFPDYYAILGIHPNASLKDIKSAYRILVMKYHPDKNPGEANHAHFLEIAKAYEILINPVERRKYHDRYFYDYEDSGNTTITAETILKNCKIFLQNLQYADPYRVNSRVFAHLAAKILTETEILYLLKTDNEKEVNEMKSILLQCINYLDFKSSESIGQKLLLLSNEDPKTLQRVQKILRQKKFEWIWKSNEWWIILIVSMVLCAIIYIIH
ncbi:MAG: J domain-containing protein [Bacteroidetes bacterium]|nr:J domain-containing protein [Bacteroidota bacterium]